MGEEEGLAVAAVLGCLLALLYSGFDVVGGRIYATGSAPTCFSGLEHDYAWSAIASTATICACLSRLIVEDVVGDTRSRDSAPNDHDIGCLWELPGCAVRCQ